jgi:uncharacterized membrane protein
MSSSEREREQRIAREAEPMILDALAEGRETREVAEEVARRYEIDEVKAYRWTHYIEEGQQKTRKRIALTALGVTWLGAIAAVVGGVALIFVATTVVWFVVTGVGILLALPALLVATLARKIAYRKGKRRTTFK